jgi:hypothetical protein
LVYVDDYDRRDGPSIKCKTCKAFSASGKVPVSADCSSACNGNSQKSIYYYKSGATIKS